MSKVNSFRCIGDAMHSASQLMLRCCGLLLVAVLLSAAPARADDAVADCNQKIDLRLRIHACSHLIKSGLLPPEALVAAYEFRGRAHYDLGDVISAIPDLDQVLRREPSNINVGALRLLARDDAMQACSQDEKQELKLRSCSALIASDQEPSRFFARAYAERGLMLMKMNRNAQAKLDLATALKMDTDFCIPSRNCAPATPEWLERVRQALSAIK